MPSAASSVGFSSGLRQGLDSARQRRMDEEERQRRHAAEDLGMEADRMTLERARRQDAREPADLAYQERLREQQLRSGDIGIESGEIGLDSARDAAARAPEELARRRAAEDLGMEADQFALGRLKTTAEQQDADRARENEDRQSAQAAQASSHMAGIFAGLQGGSDPGLLRDRFNELNQRKIRSIEYDRETGVVSMTDQDGNQREATLEDWMKVYPVPQEIIEMGKDDRLVNASTGETVVGAASDGGGGRDTSPYNDLSVQREIATAIIAAHGGQAGEIESLSDPETRDLVAYKNALGTSLEGEFREYSMDGTLTARQFGDAVLGASKDLVTNNELRERFERELGKGFSSAVPEDVDRAVEAESAAQRTRAEVAARAEIRRQILTAQQRRGERGDGSFGTREIAARPEWATGEPVGQAEDYGIQAGQQQWFEGDDGERVLLRADPYGNVFISSGEDVIQPAAQPQQAAPVQPAAPAVPASQAVPAAAEQAAERGRSELESLSAPVFGEKNSGFPGLGRSLASAGRAIAESIPESRNRFAEPRTAGTDVRQMEAARRAARDITGGREPARNDVRALAIVSPDALLAAGFAPEQVQAIRDEAIVDRSLADARRSSAEFTY